MKDLSFHVPVLTKSEIFPVDWSHPPWAKFLDHVNKATRSQNEYVKDELTNNVGEKKPAIYFLGDNNCKICVMLSVYETIKHL
jgi:hypothetical protein